MDFWYCSFVDRDMVMRYHWGLGVGHVGIGAVCSEELDLSRSGQTVSGDDARPEGDGPGPNGDDPSPNGDDLTPDSCTPGLDQNIHESAPHGTEGAEDSGSSEDSEEDSLGKLLGNQDSESENPDSEPDDPTHDKKELDHYDMYEDDDGDEDRTSYD